MSDLPTINQQVSNSPVSAATLSQPTGSMAKETEPHVGLAEAPLIQEIGQEMPLPHEVANAGVTIQPTTVTLPPSVQQLGVKAVGNPSPMMAGTTTVALPLTDDQIAQGLHQSLKSSWRWLAEWCVRQIKQLQGKVIKK